MKISEKIKQALVNEGLSSADFARSIGYTPQYVSDLLSGKRRWNETTITKACDVLGMEIVFTRKK
jgi:transcriptional regulator with XRE-family HTH domain